MSPERIDKGLYEIQWVPQSRRPAGSRRESGTPAGIVLARPRRRARCRGGCRRANCAAAATASARSSTIRRGARRDRRRVRGEPAAPRTDAPSCCNAPRREGDLAGIVDCWPLDIRRRRRRTPSRGHATRLGVVRRPAARQGARGARHRQAAPLPGHRQRATGPRDRSARRRPGGHLGARSRHRPPGIR